MLIVLAGGNQGFVPQEKEAKECCCARERGGEHPREIEGDQEEGVFRMRDILSILFAVMALLLGHATSGVKDHTAGPGPRSYHRCRAQRSWSQLQRYQHQSQTSSRNQSPTGVSLPFKAPVRDSYRMSKPPFASDLEPTQMATRRSGA
jgi:hypothetical protein